MDNTAEQTPRGAQKIASQESIQVELNRSLELTPDPEVRALLADGIRTQVTEGLVHPYQAVLHYLFRHFEGEDGELSRKALEDNPEAFRLNELRRAYEDLKSPLSMISEAGSPLSCEKHGWIYAGSVETEGNRIFSPQELASNGLKASHKRKLGDPVENGYLQPANPGSLDEARVLLYRQVRIAEMMLEFIVTKPLSCEHERIRDTDGTELPTVQELTFRAQQSMDQLKLTGSPISN